MPTPPLPPGAKLVSGDPFRPLYDSGVVATNGYRTPADIQRLRRQGYKPATNSLHLDGDAVDLVPGKSGLSMGQLLARARQAAQAAGYSANDIISEGDHVHVGIRGWGNAPGTPGTPNSGLPPMPKGAKLIQRGSLQADLGTPTGAAHDGDTFRLSSGANARLLGADAFELKQQGQRRNGSLVPLGQQARGALLRFLNGQVSGTGKATYGRPVVTLNNGGDAGASLIGDGLALAAPKYLQGTQTLAQYMEAERLARLNRRGAHALTYQTPDSFRAGNPEPWAAPEASSNGKGIAFFADEPTPFQGLRPEVASGWLALHNDRNSTAADFEAFAKANGFDFDLGENARFLKERAKHPDRPISQDINYQQAARVLTDPGDGTAGAFARGFADPFNLLDEGGAVFDALGGTRGRENIWTSDRRFGDILANNLGQNRSILGHDDAYHPYARLGGQIASGIALPYGGGVRTVGGLAKLGAAEGALAGFGAGEDWRSRFQQSVIGSGIGAAGGVALGHAGQAIAGSRIGQAVSSKLRRPAAVAAEPPPALIGSRTPDYIRVGELPPLPEGARLIDEVGGIRPMGEPLDAQSMARLFEGVDPHSLMPRPGNVVANLDEAIAANPGSFQRVTAPDEMAQLAVRRIPSGRDFYKSTRIRGPLDITKTLRTMGGVQDQGGNLAHLGIDGRPRKLPFGSNEQFLGRLIDNENGLRLDDAAELLWERGMLGSPEQRPTVDDLIQALHAENTGARHYFHPDDLAEVSDFEAAQANRFALEAQEADRGPIYERIGSEISIDDLAANQPPTSAYEDMPRLVDKVGNINLNKIERPEDVGQILDFVGKRVGGFDAAARGRVTNEETAALAHDMGMTPEQLLKRRPGQALNAEQAFAARTLLRGSLEQVGKLAKRAVGGGDADKLALEKALLKHAAIQEQVAGATAEAGRALQQFRMVAGVERAQAKAIREYLKGSKEDSLGDVAEAIIDLMEDPAKANSFIQKATKPRFKDKLVELYYNSLLSGPRTHAVNIVSNFATAVGSLPEHAFAAVLGKGRSMLGGNGERILASEIGARAVGLVQGAVDGLRAARYTFRTGKVPDLMSKVEAAQHEAIGGKVGHVLRTPTRALSAEDEFFKAIARRSELAALATRRATMEGKKGEAFNQRVADLVDSPPDDMLAQALDYARYQTFQRPVGDVAGKVMQAANAHPALKLIVPFVRTPTNIMKYAVERSPAAPLLKEWRADFLAGGARRDLAIARATLGSGLALYIMQQAAEGKITGGGPLDENARGIMRADGWQPYSIKVGNKWVSYQRLDPLAMTLGVAADYVEKQSVMTDRQRDEQAMLLVASVIQNLSDKTWLTGLSEALGALDDPVRYGPGAMRRTVAGVAVPAAVSQVASTIDPTPRESKTVGEAVQARVPGLSSDLRPALDAWGRPIQREGSFGPDIASSFYQSTPHNEVINQEALRLGLTVSKPSRNIGEERLSDADFHALRMKAGELTVEAFGALVASPEYRAMTDDQRRKAFEKIKREARKAAKAEMAASPESKGSDDPWGEFKDRPLPPLPRGARTIKQ